MKSDHPKLYDVVIDVNRIKYVTDNLKLNKAQSNSSHPFEIELQNADFNQKKTTFDDINPEILFDIFKDDELINEDQLNSLIKSILNYLEFEVKNSDENNNNNNYINLSPISSSLKKSKPTTINFNLLTLRIVETVKKMIFFECFNHNTETKQKKISNQKVFISENDSANLKNRNEFGRLIQALILILKTSTKTKQISQNENFLEIRNKRHSSIGRNMNFNAKNNITASLKQLIIKDVNRKNVLKSNKSKTIDGNFFFFYRPSFFFYYCKLE